ncbi:hypothetical protein POTOM_025711 [Populus tomentosa]|uniref:Uncharacterized protein n=1 Tax=Populus tomentosa TaxID=118781 RepID=A0A8X8CYQ9_POPTO|nr:hypothetical protein POTOM_025711 [Populus tomentosa]
MGNGYACSLVSGDEVVLWSCLWSVEGARVGSVGCGQKLPLLVEDMMEEIGKWGGDLKWGAGLGGLCGYGVWGIDRKGDKAVCEGWLFWFW